VADLPGIRVLVACLLAVTLLGGCATGPSATSDRRTVRLGDEPWTVLVAPADGMRDRADFGGADGMLFDFGQQVAPGAMVFVMDRVRFPLDISWFAGDGRPVGRATMATCPAGPCPTYAPERPYRWAIEAPVGAFDAVPADARLSDAG
jgi:uncharacterized membrane protein (UPF0127 family)